MHGQVPSRCCRHPTGSPAFELASCRQQNNSPVLRVGPIYWCGFWLDTNITLKPLTGKRRQLSNLSDLGRRKRADLDPGIRAKQVLQ